MEAYLIICIVESVNILGTRKWKMIIVSFWSLRSSKFKQGRRSGNSSYIAMFCISHWPLSCNAGKQNSVLFWLSSLSVTLICLAFSFCLAASECSLACFSSSYPFPFPPFPLFFLSFPLYSSSSTSFSTTFFLLRLSHYLSFTHTFRKNKFCLSLERHAFLNQW